MEYHSGIILTHIPAHVDYKLVDFSSSQATERILPLMANNGFNRDIERDSVVTMVQNGDKAKDGPKKVLVVGAGAAGYVHTKSSPKI